jgi:hypothetical protein
MGLVALLLGVLAVLLGLWPLVPHGSSLGLVAAACGFIPSLGALVLALSSRGRALREARPPGLHTAALAVAVLATALSGFWLLAFLYFLLRR